MTTILGIALVVIGAVGLFWRIGRTWDRAYELGWQHGRRQMREHLEDAIAQRRVAMLHLLEDSERQDEAVN